MALNARDIKIESNYERPDPLNPGTYPARLVWVISKGLQAQKPFQGQEKSPQLEVYFVYELLDEFLLDEDGEEIKDKPRFINETLPLYSLNSDKAKSTLRYFALDPTEKYKGDWTKLVGTPCMVTITQNKSKTKDIIYNNISSVQTMRDKDAKNAPDLVNEPKVFDVDDPDIEMFYSLPEWLQNDIKENLNFGGSILEEKIENTPKEQSETKNTKTKKATKTKEVIEENSEDEDW